jgi:hypothetical protein
VRKNTWQQYFEQLMDTYFSSFVMHKHKAEYLQTITVWANKEGWMMGHSGRMDTHARFGVLLL